MQEPKKWKMALLIWVIIYPTITTITLLLGSWLAQFHIFLRTFIMSIILVPFMIFIAMPLITRLFKKWLTQ